MKTKKQNTQRLVRIAVLAAIGFVLQRIQFPLILPWMKIDLAELPVIIGAFSMGPVAGILIELIKNLLSLPLTNTGGLGELANFLMGLSLVLPATLIYRKKYTMVSALIGLIVGVIAMVITSMILNYFLLLPLFFPSGLASAKTQLEPKFNSFKAICLWGVAPFNFIKGSLLTVVTMAIYKPLSSVLGTKKTKSS